MASLTSGAFEAIKLVFRFNNIMNVCKFLNVSRYPQHVPKMINFSMFFYQSIISGITVSYSPTDLKFDWCLVFFVRNLEF